MDIQIAGKHFHIPERLHDYAEEKVSKLDRYLPKAQLARVELRREQTKSASDRCIVEVTINGSGVVLRAQERSSDHYTAIDSAADALRRQARRFKTRVSKRRSGGKAAEVLAPELSIDEEPVGAVVRRKRFEMKPMPAEDAIDEMELLGHSFFLFINEETGTHNVVYRRAGGDYGLIEPEAL